MKKSDKKFLTGFAHKQMSGRGVPAKKDGNKLGLRKRVLLMRKEIPDASVSK